MTTSNKRITLINMTTSFLYEAVMLVSGLIIPKLILKSFGSEINGLVSSILQFLNLITILEGGIGGVIRAALYKPLANKDYKKVSAVFNAARSFYRKIAIIYIVYGLIVAIVYPLVFKVNMSWLSVFALTIIIAFQTFVQYFFSVNLRTLIIADRKGFVVSIVSAVLQLLTMASTIIIVSIFPNIHMIKGVGVAFFILQPIIYGLFVKKHYHIDNHEPSDIGALKQRWDGFGQNLAFFIHSNTDVVVLTILGTLLDVSVYSVYFMVVKALKALVSSLTTAITPTLGNVLAKGDEEQKNKAFDIYVFVTNALTTIAFSCGIVLITPFVSLYTRGIVDVNYYHPLLGYFLMLAEAMYCFRGPYVEVAYSSGHFKQTAIYAYGEALINIVLSIVLFFALGIEGIAIATFIAMAFRTFAHAIYTKKHLLNRPLKKFFLSLFSQTLAISLTFIITYYIPLDIANYLLWVLFALITGLISLVLWGGFTFIIERKTFFVVLKAIKNR